MDVNVLDFGAIGDDSHDDTLAFRAALNAIRATGGNCFVPYTHYKINGYGIGGNNHTPAITDNMHLVGIPHPLHGNPVLRVHEDSHAVELACAGSDWSVENINFDMMDFYGDFTIIPVASTAPMGTEPIMKPFAGAGPITVLAVAQNDNWGGRREGWTIDNCQFLNTGHNAIVARGGYFTISNCVILNNHATGTGAHPIHEGIIITPSPNNLYPYYGTFKNNALSGVGFNISGHHHLFIGNSVSQQGSGSGYFSAANNFNHDSIFIRNTSSFSGEGFDDAQSPLVIEDGIQKVAANRFFQVNGFEIWSNNCIMLANTANDCAGGGIAIGSRNAVIAFNRAVDNGRNVGNPSHHHASGFVGRSLIPPHDSTKNLSGSVLFDNVAHDTRPIGQKTQRYGFEMEAGATPYVRGMSIISNSFTGNELGEGLYGNVQPNVGYVVGRDMYANLMTEQQRNLLRGLFDYDLYRISDAQYIALNQLITGSSQARP